MLIAEIAGLAAGVFTTVACAPIAVTIFVGAFVGFTLAYVDKKYKLTEKLIYALEHLGPAVSKELKNAQQSIENAPHTIDRGIIWRTLGVDIDRGLP